MAPYFPDGKVKLLMEGLTEVREKFADLRDRYIRHPWTNAKAREYATQGFGRRLSMLMHCIETVYRVLPPGLDKIPPRDDVMEATVAIQAFVINVQGCIDNLAWVWVAEKDVRESDQTAILPKRVGLGQQNRSVRKSFSAEFRKYLDGREDWFEYLRGFRDSLAHRIPLYIPPYIVTPENLAAYEALDAAATEALIAGDLAAYEQRRAEQNALGFFRPWMTHSRTEDAPAVVFHVQLLADYNTVDELGREMLTELDR